MHRHYPHTGRYKTLLWVRKFEACINGLHHICDLFIGSGRHQISEFAERHILRERFNGSFPSFLMLGAECIFEYCGELSRTLQQSVTAVVAHFPVPNRIPKHFVSMYANSAPPVPGTVTRWRFNSGAREADGIATTCQRLIAAGVQPRSILILLSNSRALGPRIQRALTDLNIPFESASNESFKDGPAGRVVLACLRIICDRNDYVALRVLLGELPQVGVGTCNTLAEQAIANNLNYRSLFDAPLPNGVFTGQRLNALNRVRAICAELDQWQPDGSVQDVNSIPEAVLQSVTCRIGVLDWKILNSLRGCKAKRIDALIIISADECRNTCLDEVVYELLIKGI